MALRRFRADLHVHSCLSPCGELESYPRRIVERALEAGLDIVAVTDHNTAENVAATVRAAKGTRLTVLPGMEIASAEEVHVLGLFETVDDILPVQDEVFRGLPDVPAGAAFVRDQVIVDAEDGVTGFSPRFLMAATRLDVRGVVELIHRRGGLAIAAHIDRPSFSVVSQLGFVPPDLELDALEVSPLMTFAEARAGTCPRADSRWSVSPTPIGPKRSAGVDRIPAGGPAARGDPKGPSKRRRKEGP